MTTCWRSECRSGCYYPDACSERGTAAPYAVAQPATGPTPHAPAREPLSGFRWPCARRTAHGPHATPCDQCDEEGHGQCPNECPGVAAHPLTMIGGHHTDDRDE